MQAASTVNDLAHRGIMLSAVCYHHAETSERASEESAALQNSELQHALLNEQDLDHKPALVQENSLISASVLPMLRALTVPALCVKTQYTSTELKAHDDLRSTGLEPFSDFRTRAACCELTTLR